MEVQGIGRDKPPVELGPGRVVEGHSQTFDSFNPVVIVALRAYVDVVFDLALENGLFATQAFKKKPLRAHRALLLLLLRRRSIFSLKPAHNSLPWVFPSF